MITARQHDQEVMQNEVTDQGLGSNLICFGEDLFSSEFQGGMNGSSDTLIMEQISSTVQIDPDVFTDVLPSAQEFGFMGEGATQFSGGTEDLIEFGSDCFL